MRTPDHWYPPETGERISSRIASLALSPLGALYDFGGRIRFAAASPAKSEIPVICVGNLTAGGTGKTPLVITIAQHLTTLAHKPHILTRGYGGKISGPSLVNTENHSAADVGDEALLLAAAAPVWIAHDRPAGAHAARAAGAELLLMDDGFQNPSLKQHLSILVVDGESGFGNGKVIPAGPLRENAARGLSRAHAVVIMGEAKNRTLRQLARWSGPVFHARLSPPPGDFRGRYFAFAGIGRPEKFFATLNAAGADLAGTKAFADHHPYTESEIEELLRRAQWAGARLITTVKDYVRLPQVHRARIDILPVAAVFDPQERFGSFLMERLASIQQSLR